MRPRTVTANSTVIRSHQKVYSRLFSSYVHTGLYNLRPRLRNSRRLSVRHFLDISIVLYSDFSLRHLNLVLMERTSPLSRPTTWNQSISQNSLIVIGRTIRTYLYVFRVS